MNNLQKAKENVEEYTALDLLRIRAESYPTSIERWNQINKELYDQDKEIKNHKEEIMKGCENFLGSDSCGDISFDNNIIICSDCQEALKIYERAGL